MNKILIALILIIAVNCVNAQNPLTIPDTLSGSLINLNIQVGAKQFYSGNATETYGINGNILAPTLILQKHQHVTINVSNNLPDTTTIHWHGMHVAPHNDGGPHITILPGATWSPSFEVLDHASTHWYHPHLHHKTYDHVQKGIAGFIIVRDSQEKSLNLPRQYGIDDFPIAIQTKAIDANNQIITAHTALDTALWVNGTSKPYLNVPAQVIRLRLLNGSPERVYNIGLSNNRTFHQIGSDGGLLTAPVALTRLLIAPGERAEILVNLGSDSAQIVQLMNYGAEIPNARYGATQPGMGPGQTIPGYTSNPLNGANFNILEMRVQAKTTNPITTIPTSLITHTPWVESTAQATRTLTFMSMNMGPNAINGPFTINDAHFDMNVINYQIPFNNIEIWELRNQTPIAHPFHIHNVPFYILSINGVAPPDNLKGRKDVVLVPGGNGVVRFITKFETFYNDTLPYMYHCHMLTHEDDGMMGQFVVKSPCNLLSTQPKNQTAAVGGSITFTVAVNDTMGTTYQWQSNTGFGFQDLQNAGQYSGVNTNSLNISNIALLNNNQLFRCIVRNPNCDITTNVVMLQVGNTSSPTLRGTTPLLLTWPNPAQNTLNVSCDEKWLNAELHITDVYGKRVMESVLNDTQLKLNIAELDNGIYFFNVRKHTHQAVIKFIKQ